MLRRPLGSVLVPGASRAAIRRPRRKPPGRTIAEENALTGNASGWGITDVGDTGNVGFAREFSIQAGNTLNFSCHGNGTVLDVYRIGWYGGDGWRLVTTLTNTATTQPAPTSIANSNGATTCSGWSTTASWAIPADATSGLYVGVYRNSGQTNASYIPFIVRRDDRPADICYKTSDSTWALAYNHYGSPTTPLGGVSYYGTYDSTGATTWDIENRAHAATYLRPIVTRGRHEATYWLNCEAPIIRWLERNGFDISYTACRDWREGADAPNPAGCKIYISPGHDEYWSIGMRDRWEALRDNGKHLLFMSGNEVFWRTRYPDADGQIAWCYKDTMTGPGAHVAGTALDPVSWTGTWRDTRWASREPENLLTGTTFRMNGINYRTFSMAASDPICDHVFWRNTDVTTAGISVLEIIGFEADEMVPAQPVANRATLAATTVNIDGQRADDNGETYSGNGTMAWGVVSQRYSSGAVVVGFATTDWGWGLDATHDLGSNRENTQMKQATMNLLVDLGASPGSAEATLTVPTPVSLDNYGAVPA